MSYLNLDGPFGCEHALRVVVGRPELDALFGDLGQLQEADHLEVGKKHYNLMIGKTSLNVLYFKIIVRNISREKIT